MELAAHWHSCQNLQKTSEYFLQHSTGGEMILSRRDWRTDPETPGLVFALISLCFQIRMVFFYNTLEYHQTGSSYPPLQPQFLRHFRQQLIHFCYLGHRCLKQSSRQYPLHTSA